MIPVPSEQNFLPALSPSCWCKPQTHEIHMHDSLMNSQRANIAMNVAEYMVHCFSLLILTKREIMHEWSKVVSYLVVQYKEANQTYMLPTLLSTDEKYLILRNGLTGLLDMGRKFVNTAIRNPAIINARRGKMGVLL